jgi:hypothetical protein
MQIPDEIRKCVVFVAYLHKDGNLRFAGTGFFVGLESAEVQVSFCYLVTAKHVIVNAAQHSTDGFAYIRINNKSGSFELVRAPLNAWIQHSSDTNVDVAIFPWAPDQNRYEFLLYPREMFVSSEVMRKQRIGIGDDVIMVGLFASHFGRQRNVPVVRVGNISMMPEEPVETQAFGPIDAYVIEARSIGGLSGSPVFVNIGYPRRIENDQGQIVNALGAGANLYLLGLVHGHWDAKQDASDTLVVDAFAAREGRINMGMAIVVPCQKIMEVIDHPGLVDARRKEVERRKKAAEPTGTSMSGAGGSGINPA